MIDVEPAVITPARARAVLLEQAEKHPPDGEVYAALVMAAKRMSIPGGREQASLRFASRDAIAPGTTGDAFARSFHAFRPCWLEVTDPGHWRVERWNIGNDEPLSVALLLVGGDFPTMMAGIDAGFRVTNVGTESAIFEGELVGYGYKPHLWLRRGRVR